MGHISERQAPTLHMLKLQERLPAGQISESINLQCINSAFHPPGSANEDLHVHGRQTFPHQTGSRMWDHLWVKLPLSVSRQDQLGLPSLQGR